MIRKAAIKSIGKKFGKLTVIAIIKKKYVKSMAECICDCGRNKTIRLADIRKGSVKSCGCMLRETSRKRMTTHGLSNHPVYKVWKGIKKRCYNKNEKRFPDYGGRGIKMCKGWLNNPVKFYKWAISNGWKRGLDIDRINNNGDYKPSNCRFVTRKVGNNNTRGNYWIKYKGHRKTLTQWAEQIGVDYRRIAYRLKRGDTIDVVLRKAYV